MNNAEKAKPVPLEILVVDDTPANLQLLAQILSDHGYQVRPASDGFLALQSSAAKKPDLILLDVRMPDMDGYEVCRRLKANPLSRDVPVLFISALGEAADKVKGFEAGGVDFITKPFQEDEVLARVQLHLRLRELTERLEQKVEERTRELSETNSRLQLEINERIQAEEKVRQLNADLEQRVRDRTVQLEAANHELEAFSYSVSHDLRAPLRVMNGFCGFLLEDYQDKLDEQGQKYLTHIHEAGERMGQLINDLLNLSRITRTEFIRRQVDLSALAKEIASELEAQTAYHPPVDWAISDHLVADGDASLLRAALQNLISNAYKFTGKCEKPAIQVDMLQQAGNRVYFVRDNGAGFDINYAGKLFAPFQRLHSDTEFPGTGIGLAIVQRIITRHGGRIWAEAEVGHGATFFFTLDHAS